MKTLLIEVTAAEAVQITLAIRRDIAATVSAAGRVLTTPDLWRNEKHDSTSSNNEKGKENDCCG